MQRDPVGAGSSDLIEARTPAILGSLATFAAGAFLAWHHPVAPRAALIGFSLWCMVAWRWPGLWLFVVPAALPALSLSPWTGWIAFDELDLVILGTLVAGYANLGRRRTAEAGGSFLGRGQAPGRPMLIVAFLCLVATTIAFVRGLAATDFAAPDWYDGLTDPLNTLRLAKAPLFALLLIPVLRQECLRAGAETAHRVGAGMLAGAAVAVSAMLWERITYPGLFDFSLSYRTVALFWEMHVGGAAVDAYLATAMPFVLWGVIRARTPLRFACAAAFAVLAEYACLTTFSRGVYLAVGGGLLFLGLAVRRQVPHVRESSWRRRANSVVLVVAIVQLAAVFGSDSFMLARVKRSALDFDSRMQHWSTGVELLSGPMSWLLGEGSGRLPSEFSTRSARDELPGYARVAKGDGGAFLKLGGPRDNEALAGLYLLTQRVAHEQGDYHAAFDVSADQPLRLGISVCETHLLFDGRCQRADVEVAGSGAEWQHVAVKLEGERFIATHAWRRSAVFAITLLDAGREARITHVELTGRTRANLLSNGDFSQSMAHWFPVAREYFVPWHIDNFFLEILIEQGILGLAAYASLFGFAFAALFSAGQRDATLTPFLGASLTGVLLVGLVSSVLDAPRVAFLVILLALLSIQFGETPSAGDKINADRDPFPA